MAAFGVAAERFTHQPLRAHRQKCQNSYDLAREAVGCMGVLDGNRVVLLYFTPVRPDLRVQRR